MGINEVIQVGSRIKKYRKSMLEYHIQHILTMKTIIVNQMKTNCEKSLLR